MESPHRAPNAGGIDKIVFFDRPRSLRLTRITAENVCPSDTMVHWSASMKVRWRRNTRCRQQRWSSGSLFITRTAHFVTSVLRVRETYSIACSPCDIELRNNVCKIYADSRMQRGSF